MAEFSAYVRAWTELGGPNDPTVTEDEVLALLKRDEQKGRDRIRSWRGRRGTVLSRGPGFFVVHWDDAPLTGMEIARAADVEEIG